MPDNRKLAEQRALNLRDAPFHADYAAFMHYIISCGYAEKVPAEDLAYSHGKVCIPHQKEDQSCV